MPRPSFHAALDVLVMQYIQRCVKGGSGHEIKS